MSTTEQELLEAIKTIPVETWQQLARVADIAQRLPNGQGVPARKPQEKSKAGAESPLLGVREAAALLGLSAAEMTRADALGRCARFPELARIQHVRPVAGHRGSKILFVREQVEKVAARLKQPLVLEVVKRPLGVDVDAATITELLAMGKPGERTLRQMGVRV